MAGIMSNFITIGHLSRKLEIPSSTIRYWESFFNEIWKPDRSRGGQRRYCKTDIDFVRRIATLSQDMPLREVKRILVQEVSSATDNFEWDGKVVLITGGTGSFGKAFIKKLLQEHRPAAVRIYSRDELKQFQIQQEINDTRLRYQIGDVRDYQRLLKATYGVDVIIHAAAMKQVPMCEYNPFEAVKTNIIGTKNLIDAALANNVPRVIGLSTDKAVNPANLYGATKLCAEKMLVQANVYSGPRPTRFSCVRYGNVMASRGSVIPLFIEQKQKGRITITDPRMSRFWLTLSEAVDFVMKATGFMHGGEIFVPRIPSMKITDLAKAIAPECEPEIIGIRPGEKIHEILINETEARDTVSTKNMFIIHSRLKKDNGRYRGLKLESVPENFVYASNTNDRWLSVDELKAILKQEKIL